MEGERRATVSELRFVAPTSAGAATGVGTLHGYAAVFNSLSGVMGTGARSFRERIMPGAFRATLATGATVFAYYNHGLGGAIPQAAMPLGSTRDGSLRLREDDHGLAFELDMPDTSDGRDVATLVRRGTVAGVSFGFVRLRDSFHRDAAGNVRTVHEVVGLNDVSPTHQPAYAATSIDVRSLERWESGGSLSAAAAARRRQLQLAELAATVSEL